MLAGEKAIDPGDAENYHDENHPIQLHVKAVFEEVTGLSSEEIKWGIDGCNLPAPALPLSDLSRLYAILVDATDTFKSTNSSSSARKKKLARIYHAMWQYPDMVAGQGQFCTQLMLQYKGAVVGKLGADCCYGVAVRESEQTRKIGASGSLGIAVKVEDGDIEILYAVVMEVLETQDRQPRTAGESKFFPLFDSCQHLRSDDRQGVTTVPSEFV